MAEQVKEPRPVKSWIAIGFVLMAVYLAALGGGTVYGFMKDAESDRRLEQLVEANVRNAVIAKARVCVNSHERTVQIRAAINITPEALVEVSGADAEPGEVDAFLDVIQRRVDATFKTPACDLKQAQSSLADLGVEP